MKLLIFLAVSFSSIAVAKLTDETKEIPHDGSGSRVTKMRFVTRDKERILESIELSNPDGSITQRHHMLYVAGEWVATLEDNGGDGTLDGVAVLDPTTRAMEYFYVEKGLRLIPASDEEINTAEAVGEAVETFMTDAANGEEITTSKINALRFKIWLQKWELSMISTTSILAVFTFGLGRRTATSSASSKDA